MQSAGVVYELAFPAFLVVYVDRYAIARRGIDAGIRDPQELQAYTEREVEAARRYIENLKFDDMFISPGNVSSEVCITHALPPLSAYERLHPHLTGRAGLALHKGGEASGSYLETRRNQRAAILAADKLCTESGLYVDPPGGTPIADNVFSEKGYGAMEGTD